MSLYIPNLILPPDDRQDFVLCIQHDGTVLDPWGNLLNTKAIEVQPHGVLKDADALLAEIIPDRPEDTEQAVTIRVLKKILRNHIANAPTVIPASGGEEADPAEEEPT